MHENTAQRISLTPGLAALLKEALELEATHHAQDADRAAKHGDAAGYLVAEAAYWRAVSAAKRVS